MRSAASPLDATTIPTAIYLKKGDETVVALSWRREMGALMSSIRKLMLRMATRRNSSGLGNVFPPLSGVITCQLERVLLPEIRAAFRFFTVLDGPGWVGNECQPGGNWTVVKSPEQSGSRGCADLLCSRRNATRQGFGLVSHCPRQQRMVSYNIMPGYSKNHRASHGEHHRCFLFRNELNALHRKEYIAALTLANHLENTAAGSNVAGYELTFEPCSWVFRYALSDLFGITVNLRPDLITNDSLSPNSWDRTKSPTLPIGARGLSSLVSIEVRFCSLVGRLTCSEPLLHLKEALLTTLCHPPALRRRLSFLYARQRFRAQCIDRGRARNEGMNCWLRRWNSISVA